MTTQDDARRLMGQRIETLELELVAARTEIAELKATRCAACARIDTNIADLEQRFEAQHGRPYPRDIDPGDLLR